MTNNEMSLIGGLINFWERDNKKMISAMSIVKHEHFSCSDGVNLYLAINACVRDRLTPDFASVSEKLINIPNEYCNSWFAHIREITDFATSSANIKSYAYQIKAEYEAKAAYNLFAESLGVLQDMTITPRARIRKALETISSIDIRDEETKSAYTMKDALGLFIEQLEKPDRNKGLPTGFENIDRQINGLQAGNTYPIAGSPGAGKTTLALNICHTALMLNKNVIFYSLEMPAQEIITKLVSLNSKITTSYLRDGDISDEDAKSRLDATFAQLLTKNLIIDEGIGMTAENLDITTKKNEMMLGGVDLVVLDYLTLLPAQGESETVKATNAAKALKMLSKKYYTPVIILSQFVKNMIGRPKKSDLRQTGQLEQDASAIFLLYRDPEDMSHEPIIECDIAKNRWGSIGVQNLRADFARNSFAETQDVIKEVEPEKKSKVSKSDWGK